MAIEFEAVNTRFMKRLFPLTLIFLMFGFSAFAQSSNRAMLKLRLSDRSLISVSLDGRFINQETTQLTLDGIRPGLHRLEVYSEGTRRRPVRIYTGTLRLQPGTVNIGIVDVYNRGMRLRTRPADEGDFAQNNNSDRRPSDYDRNDRDDFSDNGYDGNSKDDVYNGGHRNSSDDNRDRASGHIEGQGSFPHGRGNSGYERTSNFTQRDMDDLRSRVSARITDSDKEELMKGALQGRRFSTDQVRAMLSWLSFESTRLDFAKWALPSVTDRDNYWKLEDAFDFSSSKKEFADAIRVR